MFVGFIDTMANIVPGISIAIVIIVTMLYVLSTVNNSRRINVYSYVISVAIIVLLGTQISGMIGAYSASETTKAVNEIIGEFSPALQDYVKSISHQDIKGYVIKKIFISVLIVLLGGLIIYYTMDRKKKRGHRPLSGVQSGRRYHSVSSRRY